MAGARSNQNEGSRWRAGRCPRRPQERSDLAMSKSNDSVDDDAPTLIYTPSTAAPRPRMPNQDGLWDANDVARYLKVSRSWVYHRAEAEQLPHLRVGGLLRFDPAMI